jgi:soluble lytic murein transglycosylase-like protein
LAPPRVKPRILTIDMPRRIALSAWAAIALAAISCGLAPAVAAELAAPGSSGYRLQNVDPAAFLLTNPDPGSPALQAPDGSVVAPQFAGKPFARLIDRAAREAALDPALVHAVIAVESGYDAGALSPKGAIGLMQILPATALRYGVADPSSSPEANLRAGTRYLSDLMLLFDNRVDLALAAYNAGENAVLRHGQRVPPFRETLHYVLAVLANYQASRAPMPAPPPSANRIQYMSGTEFNRDALNTAAYRPGTSRLPGQRSPAR